MNFVIRLVGIMKVKKQYIGDTFVCVRAYVCDMQFCPFLIFCS